ncbi:MAG: hypothetical protein QF741_02810 [Candidatus Peribacteraceae bacterium]|jgi:hypothetical protein|nr:hypothetical protein [Candidatus Peribacteraceae bacterium]MDP7454573.1 hypothetical protein [Candidatus Peribacteraceae bacterium]MDP7646057.1 hypothetical protein [Candidatus Peribacteraceae bacterium]
MNELEKFLASAKAVSLSDTERCAMRDEIFAGTVAKSVTGIELSKCEKRSFKKELKRFIKLNPIVSFDNLFGGLMHLKFAATAVIAAIIITSTGGGVAYAAEDTLPGDILYSFKVNVTEPLREHMHFNKDTRARWAEKRFKRRLSEAEALLNRGDVSDERMEWIQKRIAMHQVHLEKRMQSLPAGIPGEIRNHLEERMQEHMDFLTAIEKGEIPMPKLERVRGHAKKQRMHMQMMRQRPQMQHPKLKGKIKGRN